MILLEVDILRIKRKIMSDNQIVIFFCLFRFYFIYTLISLLNYARTLKVQEFAEKFLLQPTPPPPNLIKHQDYFFNILTLPVTFYNVFIYRINWICKFIWSLQSLWWSVSFFTSVSGARMFFQLFESGLYK